MKYSKTILTSILAGFSIGLGGLIYLSLDNTIVGSALFSIGLFVVLTMNFSLFTGKVCYLLEGGVKENIINIVLIWLGNLVGTGILAFVIAGTRKAEGIREKAAALCEIKNNDSYLSLFLLGILCNIFIYIAVEEYKKNEHITGKYMAIILGVMGFIIAGTEHCVADMFYYHTAGIYTAGMCGRLLVITAGNAVGGICAHTFKSIANEKIDIKG